MTLYIKYKIKDLLTNIELLAWSIGFIEFWVLMWIFVFSGNMPTLPKEYLEYKVNVNVSMGYSFLGILSIASAAIGLTYSVFHSSVAYRYITKYTKLSPVKFILEDFLGSLISLLVVVYIIFFSVYGFSIVKWRVIPHIENPIGVFIDILLTGIGYYWLSYTLTLALIVFRRTRALSMASFLPLLIGFSAYFQLWIDLKYGVYLIPFAAAPALIIYHGTGAIPPTGEYIKWFIGKSFLTSINLRMAAASLLIWIAIFIILSIFLLRRSRGVPIEELSM